MSCIKYIHQNTLIVKACLKINFSVVQHVLMTLECTVKSHAGTGEGCTGAGAMPDSAAMQETEEGTDNSNEDASNQDDHGVDISSRT